MQRIANVNVTQNSERCIRMKIQQFKDITTSLQISSKIYDKKTKMSTEGDPIHCVITSQTKYSEPLNLVLSWMISASVETCSSWFGFLIRLWREVLVSLFLNQRVTIPTKIKTSFATEQRYCFVFCNPFFNNTQFLNDHMCWN